MYRATRAVGAAFPKSESAGGIAVGQHVELHGLSDGKYNGKLGVVMCSDGDARWGVELPGKRQGGEGATKKLSLKAANLRPVSGAKPGAKPGAEEKSQASAGRQLDASVMVNLVRQNPQYSMAGLREGVYVIGMKDQLNVHDLAAPGDNPLRHEVEYVSDEMGFILWERPTKGSEKAGSAAFGSAGPAVKRARSLDDFGPYFVEQYLLLDLLSKQELAQTVLDYYEHRKEKLQRGLDSYDEAQGKGFVCWRFVMTN